jgi:5-formyltetrahydrofolate cyclo-ligase
MSVEPEKAELRRALRARRNALDASDRRLAARRLAAQVLATRAFRAARRIAVYVASDGEIDPSTILERALGMGKHGFLPVLSRLHRDSLWFAPIAPDTRFRRNRYGIPEPLCRRAMQRRAAQLDLILLPLVGFDARGNRLGMGGGFYDRSLAFLDRRARLRRPRLIGLAYEFQRVERLPAQAWDVPLDAVITDAATYFMDGNP